MSFPSINIKKGHLHALSTYIVGKETLVCTGWALAVTEVEVRQKSPNPCNDGGICSHLLSLL